MKEILTYIGLVDFAREIEHDAKDVYIPCAELGGAYVKVTVEEFVESIETCLEAMVDGEKPLPNFSYIVDEQGDFWINSAQPALN